MFAFVRVLRKKEKENKVPGRPSNIFEKTNATDGQKLVASPPLVYRPKSAKSCKRRLKGDKTKGCTRSEIVSDGQTSAARTFALPACSKPRIEDARVVWQKLENATPLALFFPPLRREFGSAFFAAAKHPWRLVRHKAQIAPPCGPSENVRFFSRSFLPGSVGAFR